MGIRSTARHVAGAAIGLAVVLGVAAAADVNVRIDGYVQHNLVSDGAVKADHTDPNLVNAWGVAPNPNGVTWVADNGSGLSTLYDGQGVAQSLVVTVAGGSPTGLVFSGSNDFKVGGNPARFIFASENGTIDAWVPPATSTQSVVNNANSGAVYKGIALAGTGTGHFLYATDFHNAKIDVFDANFAPVTMPGSFRDPRIPAGFAPFGIQNINGDLYVTYAKQDAAAHDDVKGPGLGFVDVYDAQGRLVRRIASRGPLNAPWGLALAPANFGRFSNHLLVGNFGDGAINAYDPLTGEFRGQLRAPNRNPLRIDGLWGLAFGNGVANQPTNALFFAAGPNDEANGLYGRIDPATPDLLPDQNP